LLTPSQLKIGRNETLCLALNVGITMRHWPRAGDAIILKLAIFHGNMLALAGEMQQDTVPTVFGYGETHRIKLTGGRNPAALAGIAQVAEVFEFRIFRHAAGLPCSAVAAKSCAQRETLWKRPQDTGAFFSREEKRASHNRLILVRFAVDMLNFFLCLR